MRLQSAGQSASDNGGGRGRLLAGARMLPLASADVLRNVRAHLRAQILNRRASEIVTPDNNRNGASRCDERLGFHQEFNFQHANGLQNSSEWLSSYSASVSFC